jgi:restriction system protein
VVLTEARRDYFLIRLWDADDLLDALVDVYDQLPDEVRSALPLKRVWALVPPG